MEPGVSIVIGIVLESTAPVLRFILEFVTSWKALYVEFPVPITDTLNVYNELFAGLLFLVKPPCAPNAPVL